MSRERKSSGFAVFIILAGIGILLYNMNMLSLDMFWGIVHLWPLLLVIAGLSIIFRRVRYMDVVLWLVFIGVVIAYSYLNLDQKSWTIGENVESENFSVEAVDIENGTINLDMATGNIDVSVNGDDKFDYAIPVYGRKTHTVKQDGNDFVFDVRDKGSNDLGLFTSNRFYTLEVPPTGEWAIDIDGAVIDSNIELSGIDAKSVKIDFAVGDVFILIGEARASLYDIDFAIGNVIVDIPDDANVKVYYNGALSAIDVPSDYTKDGNYYYSKGFNDSEDYMEIRVDLAIGNVEIK
ncbi:hypothetical protein EZV73_23685 [Acidaminobacter sp. JC074]|uniref:LiaF transmembrane domain-containing protein n=1 Tax=Acidaminobacter sp. JC074 TaxID=2530199 RepID=UPI001F0E9C24|nr:hypothetical protein [Acidaminobacter sp. JC074]MCH4890604.1 hypothetical protein [Acidaminobacter sp. JC074]